MKVPDRITNTIAEAVRDAIAENVDPRSFVQEVQACWSDELHDKRRMDNKTFEDILSGRPRL